MYVNVTASPVTYMYLHLLFQVTSRQAYLISILTILDPINVRCSAARTNNRSLCLQLNVRVQVYGMIFLPTFAMSIVLFKKMICAYLN